MHVNLTPERRELPPEAVRDALEAVLHPERDIPPCHVCGRAGAEKELEIGTMKVIGICRIRRMRKHWGPFLTKLRFNGEECKPHVD